MENIKNNKSFDETEKSNQVKSGQVRSHPSIFAELERVKTQVEFNCLGHWVKKANGDYLTDNTGNKVMHIEPIYEELCLIIAEVNLLSPDCLIKVAGAETSAFIVQEVYTRLRSEHLENVTNNFQKISWTINHKKTYLRTALYNTVFENAITEINQIARS